MWNPRQHGACQRNWSGRACGLASGLAPFVGASRTWVTNSSDIRRAADYTMDQAHGGIAYSRPVLGELAVVVSVKDAHYPHRLGTLLTDHFHVFSIGSRYSRDIGSRLQGSVALNRTTVDSGAGFPKFTGLTSDVSLTAKASDNIQGHFSGCGMFSRSMWDLALSISTAGFPETWTTGSTAPDAHRRRRLRIYRHIEGELLIPSRCCSANGECSNPCA